MKGKKRNSVSYIEINDSINYTPVECEEIEIWVLQMCSYYTLAKNKVWFLRSYDYGALHTNQWYFVPSRDFLSDLKWLYEKKYRDYHHFLVEQLF